LTCLWRAVPPDQTLWVGWDDGFVLFHRLSGKTHFLNAAGALLLTRVLQVAKDTPTAARALAQAQHAESDESFVGHVEDLLRRLEELGLVERAETGQA
jgi:PqqD family protein of HPr-rel-A system